MSIPVLVQTYDEVRRLAIAGSVVAPGDFRLKKIVPQLEQAGQKAPVFAKVAEAANRLIESTEKTSASALLELTTLVSAILYTQGETGADGELTPIKTIELSRPKTQASARVLKPLLEALTTTGSGRLEIIREAFERGAFGDLRLIAPGLRALDDTYSEIGDLVANKILPLYGQAILPELEATFDPTGRGGHVRRLQLMHRLDPQVARAYVQRSLDEGSKEVRIAAISCLGDSPQDLAFLLEQVKAKAKDVRTAALAALGRSRSDDAGKVLCEAIAGADLAQAVEPVRVSRHPLVTEFLHDAVEKQLDTLLTGKESDAKKLSKQNERMCLLLDCLRERDDKRTEALLLKMFDQSAQLSKVKGEPSGKDVVERLVHVMTAGPAKVQAALVDSHASLSAESLTPAFIAACRSRTPAAVFQIFSPYLTAKVDEKKKNRDPAYAKREAIVMLLAHERNWWHYDPEALARGEEAKADFDPRWLDVAVQLGRTDLLEALAVPGHVKANALLEQLFQVQLAKKIDPYEVFKIVGTMIRVRHPRAIDATIELIQAEAKGKGSSGYYWVGSLVPRLPKEAVPKLEALLPTLPEKMVDYLLDYVTHLKNS